jgi:hypothetical protein
METSIFNGREVQITSVYFRNDPAAHRLDSYPRRMVMDGREYNFLESGMRYLVHKGQQLISLFDVSDGQTEYRLRVDGENRWTLIGTKAGA